MTLTSTHTQVCLQTWINCENLLNSLAQVKSGISNKITRVIDECAHICMGTFQALKNRSSNISRYALLCVGICEECAELCEKLADEQFMVCARMCRKCSERMTHIAFTSLQ
jgi:hypothetical protein